jgi:hypothetical protein
MVSIATAARAVLVFALISVAGAAVAQGAPPAKKPTMGRKPIVQAKPRMPVGCKLVGSARGTKIWAGDCVGATELRVLSLRKKSYRPNRRRCRRERSIEAQQYAGFA